MKDSPRFARLLLAGLISLGIAPSVSNAQYFTSATTERQVLKSSGRDSVIVDLATTFEVPPPNDTFKFMYHEPMPDSIMPRSAVVIGTITLQFEDIEDLTPALEKYARKLGADWIVSFQEPRAYLTKDRWKVYRSTATLLHVLDAQFINQADISYSYYEKNKFSNFASVSSWFDQYGKRMGANIEQPAPVEPSQQDENNPDK